MFSHACNLSAGGGLCWRKQNLKLHSLSGAFKSFKGFVNPIRLISTFPKQISLRNLVNHLLFDPKCYTFGVYKTTSLGIS